MPSFSIACGLQVERGYHKSSRKTSRSLLSYERHQDSCTHGAVLPDLTQAAMPRRSGALAGTLALVFLPNSSAHPFQASYGEVSSRRNARTDDLWAMGASNQGSTSAAYGGSLVQEGQGTSEHPHRYSTEAAQRQPNGASLQKDAQARKEES